MIEQVVTIEFGLEILLALVLLALARASSSDYAKEGTRAKSIESLRAPNQNALVVMGLLVPVTATLTGYLYVTKPGGNYASLLAAIVMIVATLIFASWHNFSLLKFNVSEGTINLTLPVDRKFITVSAWIFVLQILAVLYVMFFLVARLEPTPKTASPPTPRPRICREELSAWAFWCIREGAHLQVCDEADRPDEVSTVNPLNFSKEDP